MTAGALKGAPLVKSGAVAWSCFLATAISQRFGTADHIPSQKDIASLLGLANRASSGATHAVDLGLLSSVQRDDIAPGVLVIKLRVGEEMGDMNDFYAGSDAKLVLTTLLYWAYGQIPKLGNTAIQVQLAALAMSNLTQREFRASGVALAEFVGLNPSYGSKGLATLRELRLIRSRGKQRAMSQELLIPPCLPGTRALLRGRRLIERMPQEVGLPSGVPNDDRTRFCRQLVQVLDSVACERISPYDLHALLCIAVKAEFDPDRTVKLTGKNFLDLGVSNPANVIDRLVLCKFVRLATSNQPAGVATARKPRPLQLLISNPTFGPVVASDASTFTRIVERMLESETISRIHKGDLCVYVAVAVEATFRFGYPLRTSTRVLTKRTGINENSIAARLWRLQKARLVDGLVGDSIKFLALIDDPQAGRVWSPKSRRPKSSHAKFQQARVRKDASKHPVDGKRDAPTERAAPVASSRPLSATDPSSRPPAAPLKNQFEDPVSVIWVVQQIGHRAGRSDNIARKMKTRGYRVETLARKHYCERADAIKMFPRFRKRLELNPESSS